VVWASRLNEEGRQLYQDGDLEGAAAKFAEAMRAAPDTEAANIARQNLANTYNQLGLQAYDRQDFDTAERYWSRTLQIDPENMDAKDNLGRLHQRSSTLPSRLPNEFGSSIPQSSGDRPFSSLMPREQEAQRFLNEGIDAYRRGDISTARDDWQRAVEAAPGTDAALKAQDLLDRTASTPGFEGD